MCSLHSWMCPCPPGCAPAQLDVPPSPLAVPLHPWHHQHSCLQPFTFSSLPFPVSCCSEGWALLHERLWGRTGAGSFWAAPSPHLWAVWAFVLPSGLSQTPNEGGAGVPIPAQIGTWGRALVLASKLGWMSLEGFSSLNDPLIPNESAQIPLLCSSLGSFHFLTLPGRFHPALLNW